MRRLLAPLRLWFTLDLPVGRRAYLLSGLLLVPLKIAIDSALFRAATGRPWPLTGYLHPSFNLRFGGLPHDEVWVAWALAAVTLPFLWVGISLTVRRCRDAGLSPVWGLLFFAPAVNYVLMAVLCCVPGRPRAAPVGSWTGRRVEPSSSPAVWGHGVAAGAALGLAMILVSVGLLRSYGLALFVGAPFVMGVVSSFILVRRSDVGRREAITIGQLTLVVSALAILMFALEGALCLAMAYPLAALLAFLGSVLGSVLGRMSHAGTAPTGALVALPFLLATDTLFGPPPVREVLTALEIDARPEDVWAHVVAFPELQPPREWIFRLGIAYPVGARIDGRGVGAVRSCEFSTGAFVEPITAWDPPERLAFDVVAQPPPMREISPYANVFAPHLVDGMVSRRGEFRLVPLPGGRTRLEGRTWYVLDLAPQAYWSLWSDFVVHRIHRRVLEHVAGLSERAAS